MLSSLCGLPASGKTTLAKQLERQHRARRLSPERAIVPGAPEDETWERLVREGHAQRIAAALARSSRRCSAGCRATRSAGSRCRAP